MEKVQFSAKQIELASHFFSGTTSKVIEKQLQKIYKFEDVNEILDYALIADEDENNPNVVSVNIMHDFSSQLTVQAFKNLIDSAEVAEKPTEKQIEEAKKVLRKAGYVMNIWYKSDFENYSKNEGFNLTDEQIDNVIEKCENLDPNIGITWNSVYEIMKFEFEQNYFSRISGFWKDSKFKFHERLVFHKSFEELPDFVNDEEVFFYISEEDIKKAINQKWESEHDFVITSYKKGL